MSCTDCCVGVDMGLTVGQAGWRECLVVVLVDRYW